MYWLEIWKIGEWVLFVHLDFVLSVGEGKDEDGCEMGS